MEESIMDMLVGLIVPDEILKSFKGHIPDSFHALLLPSSNVKNTNVVCQA